MESCKQELFRRVLTICETKDCPFRMSDGGCSSNWIRVGFVPNALLPNAGSTNDTAGSVQLAEPAIPKNAVTGTECLQRGTVDKSAVYVRKVIERALAHKASGFILAHNHPSGDPTPSAHDRELTQAIKAAAAAVGIRFLDHLIIGDAAPFSFKANGLL